MIDEKPTILLDVNVRHGAPDYPPAASMVKDEPRYGEAA